ncbi:MAG: twin-arginine translocase TatA/TatE family subunit [Candidatus Acidiferrales bacterium]
MFSVPHLIIIFVVVLIVFGPEKLPDLARNLGKIMGEFRRATGDLRSTFDEHMREIEREASVRAAAGAGSTVAPTEQNTIGQPKLVGATGTVTADAPRGWTVAPAGSSSGENAAGEMTGATQADTPTTPPDLSDGKTAESSASVSAANAGATQDEATAALVGTEKEGAGESAKADDSKGSDGGSHPA